MNVCPECFSANIYRRVKYASGYKCKKCRGAFDSPLHVERTGAPVGGRGTLFERTQRIQRIREVHLANPEYTQKDLRMVCFESDWMVAKYWKHYRVQSSEIAINKTV